MCNKVFVVIVFLSWVLCLPSIADLKDDEITRLKEQLKQSRIENQAIRKQLAQGDVSTRQNTSPPPVTETPSTVRQPAASSQRAEQTYWITTSSSKRHNSSCRFYKNSKGRPCTKNEGISCKICGG